MVLPPSTFMARRKAALNAVVAQVNASGLKPASLGAFSVAPERELWSSLHNPQIRAAGGPKLDGAEFRSFIGLGNVGPSVGRISSTTSSTMRASSFGRQDRVGSPDR